MPEQFLDHPHVDAIPQQMHGERVAQQVRMNMDADERRDAGRRM